MQADTKGGQTMITFSLLPSNKLVVYQQSLEDLEKEFSYPLSGGRSFKISHGSDYKAFFDQMGEAQFILAHDGNDLVAVMTATYKDIMIGGEVRKALYLADLKVRSSHRGKILGLRMYWRSFLYGLMRKEFWRSDLIYFVTMQGERGDFASHSPKFSPVSLFSSLAEFSIFFADPLRVASITELSVAERVDKSSVLGLSPVTAMALTVDLKGKKDLLVDGEILPMRLTHLNSLDLWGQDYLKLLVDTGRKISSSHAQLCFAVDKRRGDLLKHLAINGIKPSGSALIHGLSLNRSIRNSTFCTVGTFQI
ncbi:MAG: hypothetical protein HY225_03885 [Candidatus Vogelbacteria bacterium]|nr:hypothetical protein [Candidatus Vogelbacteria bacterium]